jgi:hypothetical protein
VLKVLDDAGHYVAGLPKAMQSGVAGGGGLLLQAAKRGGIVMLADIAVRKALYAGKLVQPKAGERWAKRYRIIR